MFDIKARRKELGLTLEEVGDAVGVGKSTVRKWENGLINNMKRDKIASLAKILKVSPLDIVLDERSLDNLADQISTTCNELTEGRKQNVLSFAKHQLNEQNGLIEETGPIYHVGLTAAGPPLEYSQIPPEQMTAEIPHGAEFALTVKGDSMEPLIKNGSIIFFKEQPTVENGEIAIVEIDGNAVTCKKFYYDGSKAVLRSINPKYPDLEYNEGVRIIGKVIL